MRDIFYGGVFFFHHLVVAIEESKNIVKTKFEELQGSFEAHEHRLDEREAEKIIEQAL
jgi:hypothetical protein